MEMQTLHCASEAPAVHTDAGCEPSLSHPNALVVAGAAAGDEDDCDEAAHAVAVYRVPQDAAGAVVQRCYKRTPKRNPLRCLTLATCWPFAGNDATSDRQALLNGAYSSFISFFFELCAWLLPAFSF